MRSYSKTAKLKKLIEDIFFIDQKKCFFCKKLLEDPYQTTVHHINGHHEDNIPENMILVHTRCHKAYHCSKTMKGRKK